MSNEYLLQNGWSGNSPLFWKLGSCGYTTDISQAQVFSKKAAYNQHRARQADKPWPLNIVKRHAVMTVNFDKVPSGEYEQMNKEWAREYSLKTPPEHDLFQDGDPEIPDIITDANGQVALGMCRRCDAAESDLKNDCFYPN